MNMIKSVVGYIVGWVPEFFSCLGHIVGWKSEYSGFFGYIFSWTSVVGIPPVPIPIPEEIQLFMYGHK